MKFSRPTTNLTIRRRAQKRSFRLAQRRRGRGFDCRRRSSHAPASVGRLTFHGGRDRTGSGQRRADNVTRHRRVGSCAWDMDMPPDLPSDTWHGRNIQLFCSLSLHYTQTLYRVVNSYACKLQSWRDVVYWIRQSNTTCLKSKNKRSPNWKHDYRRAIKNG